MRTWNLQENEETAASSDNDEALKSSAPRRDAARARARARVQNDRILCAIDEQSGSQREIGRRKVPSANCFTRTGNPLFSVVCSNCFIRLGVLAGIVTCMPRDNGSANVIN